MLLMCIWMSPYHVTAAPVCQALLEFSQNPGYLLKKGSEHIEVVYAIAIDKVSHIYLHTHKNKKFDNLYAVEMHMDEAIPRYGCSCPSRYRNFPGIPDTSLGATHGVLWL